MQTSRASSLQAYSNVSGSKTTASSGTSLGYEESDDALDIALYILDQTPAKEAPPPPPCVHNMLTEWRANLKNVCVCNTPNDYSGFRPSRRHDSSSHSIDKPSRNTKPWSYAEDCVLAHTFSAVTPDAQRAHLTRNLPKRSWKDARARFHYLCTMREAPKKHRLKHRLKHQSTSGTK